jgi:hypothetical protein
MFMVILFHPVFQVLKIVLMEYAFHYFLFTFHL